MIRQIAQEVAMHVLTLAVVLLMAAGVSHRLGANACGKHSSYAAQAAVPRK